MNDPKFTYTVWKLRNFTATVFSQIFPSNQRFTVLKNLTVNQFDEKMYFHLENISWNHFGKNFVKVTVLIKKLLKSWFDEMFIWWEYCIFLIAVLKLLNQFLVSWNRRFVWISRNFVVAIFSQTFCERNCFTNKSYHTVQFGDEDQNNIWRFPEKSTIFFVKSTFYEIIV